jgi:hypothetical protein
MRLLVLMLLNSLSGTALAETVAPAPVPPPPVLSQDADAPDAEPAVTIKEEADQTVEEYRSAGRLYMIKVTPKHGKPYYLIDQRGDGKFARQDALDSGVRVPQWVIHRF